MVWAKFAEAAAGSASTARVVSKTWIGVRIAPQSPPSTRVGKLLQLATQDARSLSCDRHSPAPSRADYAEATATRELPGSTTAPSAAGNGAAAAAGGDRARRRRHPVHDRELVCLRELAVRGAHHRRKLDLLRDVAAD